MPTTATGILSFGAYLPQRRLQRSAIYSANAWFAPGLRGLSKGERAIANWDEDTVTMAVEAGRDALATFDRGEVRGVSLASTTLPFADRLNAGIVKEALNLADEVSSMDAAGGRRAGTSALIQALQSTDTGGGAQLCLAADLRKAAPASEGELLWGDGAAAILVGSGEPIAEFLGAHSVTVDFIDQYRATGEDFDYAWESRWIREEGHLGIAAQGLSAALAKLGMGAAQIDHCAIAICSPKAAEAVAKAAGIPRDALLDTLVGQVGDTGAAHPLLMLAAALERAKPGETILVLGFGQGIDVLLFRATDAIANKSQRLGVAGSIARGVADENYLRFLFHRNLLPLDRGARAEFDQKQPSTTLYRNRKTVLGLVGGRCTKTGTVQFPKSMIGVNPNDHALRTQEDYPLADKVARVLTYTADSLTYSPDPPNYYGAIDFEGGGRMTVEFADVDGVEIDVGQPMRMMFRIKAVDERRHFFRYFWKAAPSA